MLMFGFPIHKTDELRNEVDEKAYFAIKGLSESNQTLTHSL